MFFDNKTASIHAQIYIQHADGTAVVHLVVSDFDDRAPALSPDGRTVAFTRSAPEGSSAGGVFIVNIDGTGQKRVDVEGEDVSWSPDGTQLVETRAFFDKGAATPHNTGLWIVNVATGAALGPPVYLGIRRGWA